MTFNSPDTSRWTTSRPLASETALHPSGQASYWGDNLLANASLVLLVNDAAVDLEGKRIKALRFRSSYTDPTTLEFREGTKHYTGTYKPGDAVELRLNHTTRFRGWITREPRKAGPGEHVSYVATDARHRANLITVTNELGEPRLVFNATPDDPDYEPSRANMTTGQIIAWLFQHHSGDLQAQSLTADFSQRDLDALTTTPARLPLINLKLDQALLEILKQEPNIRHRFNPHNNCWYFDNLGAPQPETITYNRDTVAAADLGRSIEDVATAVRIVGGARLVDSTRQLSLETIEQYWSDEDAALWTQQNSDPASGLALYPNVGRRYRIIDTEPGIQAKARRINGTTTNGSPPQVYVYASGDWTEVTATFNSADGTFLLDHVALGPGANPNTPGGFVPAEDIRLFYAYKDDAITARAPAAGYEGTAYTICGIQSEASFSIPSFTLDSQQGEFDAYAQSILDTIKNIAWSGTITLATTQLWDWFTMARAVNIASVDNQGVPRITGMEEVAAALETLEIDTLADTTKLILSTELAKTTFLKLVERSTADTRKMVHNSWSSTIRAGAPVVTTGDTTILNGKAYENVTQPTADSQTPAYIAAESAAPGKLFWVWKHNQAPWINIDTTDTFEEGDTIGTKANTFTIQKGNTGLGIILETITR